MGGDRNGATGAGECAGRNATLHSACFFERCGLRGPGRSNQRGLADLQYSRVGSNLAESVLKQPSPPLQVLLAITSGQPSYKPLNSPIDKHRGDSSKDRLWTRRNSRMLQTQAEGDTASSPASLGSTDHSQVDMLGLRYKPINFGAVNIPGTTR